MMVKLIDIYLMFFLINLEESFIWALISLIQECIHLELKQKRFLLTIAYLNGKKPNTNMNRSMTNMDLTGLDSNHLILILLVQAII